MLTRRSFATTYSIPFCAKKTPSITDTIQSILPKLTIKTLTTITAPDQHGDQVNLLVIIKSHGILNELSFDIHSVQNYCDAVCKVELNI